MVKFLPDVGAHMKCRLTTEKNVGAQMAFTF
jgi:hypothetical protein